MEDSEQTAAAPADNTTTDSNHSDSNSSSGNNSTSFDSIVDKDAKLDRFLLEAVQLIKQMHDLKMEIKTKQNQFDEDRIGFLKSSYLTLHTRKLSNFNEILKAVEEITS